MSQEIPEEIVNQIKEFAAKMMEHCDSVRIFVTAHDGNTQQTNSCDFGAGNLYAQQGQIEEWCRAMREYERCQARKKFNEPRSDD